LSKDKSSPAAFRMTRQQARLMLALVGALLALVLAAGVMVARRPRPSAAHRARQIDSQAELSAPPTTEAVPTPTADIPATDAAVAAVADNATSLTLIVTPTFVNPYGTERAEGEVEARFFADQDSDMISSATLSLGRTNTIAVPWNTRIAAFKPDGPHLRGYAMVVAVPAPDDAAARHLAVRVPLLISWGEGEREAIRKIMPRDLGWRVSPSAFDKLPDDAISSDSLQLDITFETAAPGSVEILVPWLNSDVASLPKERAELLTVFERIESLVISSQRPSNVLIQPEGVTYSGAAPPTEDPKSEQFPRWGTGYGRMTEGGMSYSEDLFTVGAESAEGILPHGNYSATVTTTWGRLGLSPSFWVLDGGLTTVSVPSSIGSMTIVSVIDGDAPAGQRVPIAGASLSTYQGHHEGTGSIMGRWPLVWPESTPYEDWKPQITSIRAVTNHEGLAYLPCLLNVQGHLTVTHRDFQPATAPVSVFDRQDQRLEIVLHRHLANLDVLVVDEQNKPIPGANVGITPMVNYGSDVRIELNEETDESGRLQESIPPGSWHVYAESDGYQYGYTAPIVLDPGDAVSVRVCLTKLVTLEILLTRGGQPVDNAELQLLDRSSMEDKTGWWIREYGRTNENGIAALLVSPGRYWMIVEGRSVELPLVTPEGNHRFSFEIGESRTITGSLVDAETGKPMDMSVFKKDVYAVAFPIMLGGLSLPPSASYDPNSFGEIQEDGTFVIKDLAPGEWIVGVNERDFARKMTEVTVPSDRDPDPVVLELDRYRGTLRFELVDTKGVPIRWAGGEMIDEHGSVRVFQAKSGRHVEFDGVVPGLYIVTLEMGMFDRDPMNRMFLPWTSDPIDVPRPPAPEPGKPVEPSITVVKAVLEDAGAVQIDVCWPDGRPMEGALLTMSALDDGEGADARQDISPKKANVSGRAIFMSLVPGPYSLAVDAPNGNRVADIQVTIEPHQVARVVYPDPPPKPSLEDR